jgi:CheY-like chemotaxis protein
VNNNSILIVEDNHINVQLVRVLLAGEGYDLRSAINADEALNTLATFKPSLVLMDIQLPGKSGLELTRQLRANPELNEHQHRRAHRLWKERRRAELPERRLRWIHRKTHQHIHVSGDYSFFH